MATYQEDYREQNNPNISNDKLGENSEQTQLAIAVTQKNEDAEHKGWDNNIAGSTSENQNNQSIPTVTPENDNGIAGPFGIIDGEISRSGLEDDSDPNDDDLEEDDALIPIETEDDDVFAVDDDRDMDDDNLDNDEKDEDFDPLVRPTTF